MALTLGFGKLPWHGQIGAFLLVALLGGAVFRQFYATPVQQTIDDRRAQVVAMRGEVDKGMATARRLPQFRREVAMLERQLDRLKTVLPEEKDVADLLRRIQGMATESNLTIRAFTPQAVATRQLHAEWPIGLELDGTYHNLGRFLERVSSFPRIINVAGISIKARDKPVPGGSTVTALCTATTFVLLETPKPDSASPSTHGGLAAGGAHAPTGTE